MSVLASPARIAFRPHFCVRAVDEKSVALLSDGGSFMLRGKLYAMLVPYLQGEHSAPEILAAMAGRAPGERVRTALETLLAKGYASPVDDAVAPGRAAYWIELGRPPAEAEACVASLRVAVRALPGSDLAGVVPLLGAALADSGIVVDDRSPTLTLLLVADYLQPELQEINREMLAASRGWVPFKPGGMQPWLGPFFAPGGKPCWTCLSRRLNRNRHQALSLEDGSSVIPEPRAALGAATMLATGFAAHELVRFGAGAASGAAETLLTFDLRRLALERHHVARLPACPECGDAARDLEDACRPLVLQRALARSHDGGMRVQSAREALERLERHVSPITGVVSGIKDSSPADGLPVFQAIGLNRVSVGPRQNRLMGNPGSAAGKGMSPAQARASCIAEALERYALAWQGDEPHRRARLADLGDDALDPRRLLLFSEAQYAAREAWNAAHDAFNRVRERFEPERPIDWSPAWSVTHDALRWLPTRYCYMRYEDGTDHAFCAADTNGCAAGATLEEAILQGLLELIERDACALWWYNRAARPAIDLDTIDEPFLRHAIRHYRAMGRELWVLDLTTDLGIPVAVALSHDGQGRRIHLGLGCALDRKAAALRAVSEHNQLAAIDSGAPRAVKPEDRNGLDDWLDNATVEEHRYLLPAAGAAPQAVAELGDVSELRGTIERLAAMLAEHGLELVVQELRRPEIDIAAARVVVPGLRHFWARFAPGRLYDVPVRLGWQETATAEADLNPLCFFL
jgi:ribosomal protein S12 methylthiotransferase accessory factor